MKIYNRFTKQVILEIEKLMDANLTRANLTHADLSGANLTRSNLTHADLSGANLTHAHLPGADLRHANLIGADLTHADLRRADLTHADLRRANLTGADLDFSSGISFKCTSFGCKVDLRLVAQMCCHIARFKSEDTKANEIIDEIKSKWGNLFCDFRNDVDPI